MKMYYDKSQHNGMTLVLVWYRVCGMEHVVCDIDLCIQIQQGSKEKVKYSSSWDCARQLYKEGGITNVYRGTMATLLRGMTVEGVVGMTT